jgi:hypothetical protein
MLCTFRLCVWGFKAFYATRKKPSFRSFNGVWKKVKIVKILLVRPLFRSVPVDILSCIWARFEEQRRKHSSLSTQR